MLCYDCEARCRLGRVALRQGASEGARIIEARWQGGKVRGVAMRWRGKVRGEMIEHRGIVRRDRAEASRHRARSMRTRRLGGGATLISKTYQRRAPDKNKQLKRIHIYSESILNLGL